MNRLSWLRCMVLAVCILPTFGFKRNSEIPISRLFPNKTQEYVEFAKKELEPVLKEIISGSSYPLVRKRYSEGEQLVYREFSKAMQISLSTAYHFVSKDIESAIGDRNKPGEPVIYLVIPALKDTFDALERSGHARWRESFQSHVTIVVMHQMEYFRDLRKDKLNKSVDLAEASKIWRNTCRFTIDPLVKSYKAPIIEEDKIIYDVWLDSKENDQDPIWKMIIEKKYVSPSSSR